MYNPIDQKGSFKGEQDTADLGANIDANNTCTTFP